MNTERFFSNLGGAALLLLLSVLLVACGGGGGDRAVVNPGPTPPDQGQPPPAPIPPSASLDEAEQVLADITAVSIPDDGRPLVDFQVVNGNNVAILDVESADVRFIIAKLQGSSLGNLTGDWQSYINRIETPAVGPGSEPRLQATTEADGELTNNNDGTYRYRFANSLTNLPSEWLQQAATENLDLSYEPQQTHRVSIQFSNTANPLNPIYDFVPASGASSDIFHYNVVATANCNRCHEQLALHGGGRIETRYCVTCHNPGSTDANSENSVDFKQMIHKIHRGQNLPSVAGGGQYVIYGYRDSLHDYSGIAYPQDIRHCENCHAGSASGNDNLVLTSEGDNWSVFASRAACGSCHDDVDFATHFGGQSNDDNCMGCHSATGPAGSIVDSHRNLVAEQSALVKAEILSVDNTGVGQMPTVNFRVFNPTDDSNYDILNDPLFTGARLAVTLGWSTSDYHNTGNGSDAASTVSMNPLSAGMDNGDGSFSVTSTVAIPDGSAAPNVAASGSGVSVIEGRLSVDVDGDASNDQIPLDNAHAFFSIDEAGGSAVARRSVAELDSCLNCHASLNLHGNNRSNNLNSCVTCHNPRNTDREVREIAVSPPTDGKDEESLDFKTMVHGIHAAAFRENPLQVVGFSGFSTYVYDTDHVHYPGVLGNCAACHGSSGYQLPLASSVLGTTIDTGSDHADSADDIVISPASAVCASCHDGNLAAAHMESFGGSFATTQAALDDGSVLEQCSLCHGSGGIADVESVHPITP